MAKTAVAALEGTLLGKNLTQIQGGISFSLTTKKEWVWQHQFKALGEVYLGIADQLDHDNHQEHHPEVGYQSPATCTAKLVA